MRVHVLTLVAVVALGGCATSEDAWGDYESAPEWLQKAWGTSDDPSLLGDDFVTQLADLPDAGEADQVPWAGNYWPTYKDSLNHKWEGASSTPPSTKYAQAFGRTGLEDRISAEYGIDSRSHDTECTETTQCDTDKGETCAKRDGADSGYCIETWFGICHAWAPASVMEKEPEQAVTHNGVEFKVNDIKALISLSYDGGANVKFMSLRCDESASGPDAMEMDDLGNPVPDECADTNPGSFHIAVSNLLGIQKVSFIEDRTFDYEVWNQPVRSYAVTRNDLVSASAANALLGLPGSTYTPNADAATLRHVEMDLSYITESHADTDGNLASTIDTYTVTDHYTYILEIDAAGDIIGGEWVGASKTNHPDFLWLVTDKADTELANDGTPDSGVKWTDVQMLLEQSLVSEESEDTGGFDWGSACEDGEGTFEQPIARQDTVTVGSIPVDRAGVRIDLTSPQDVDIQLIDEETGFEIVAWPHGDLNGSGEACTTHHGIEICYSGYNGVGGEYGHEWIEVRGTTNRALVMKAYGYAAGDAQVDYSWQASEDCVDTGSGSFTQNIAHQAVVDVGVIPTGKTNLKIVLESDVDVDVQLYDGTTALVQWPDGQLSGAGEASMTYKGMTITWSGYNGVDGLLGHEFITVEGEVSTDLTMKAYGYAAGDAQVNYSWGLDASEL
jgi:hypothetical protein